MAILKMYIHAQVEEMRNKKWEQDEVVEDLVAVLAALRINRGVYIDDHDGTVKMVTYAANYKRDGKETAIPFLEGVVFSISGFCVKEKDGKPVVHLQRGSIGGVINNTNCTAVDFTTAQLNDGLGGKICGVYRIVTDE